MIDREAKTDREYQRSKNMYYSRYISPLFRCYLPDIIKVMNVQHVKEQI